MGRPEPTPDFLPTANERLRDRWEAYLRWSTAAAVVVHVAVFGLSPSWETSIPERERARYEGMSLVALPPLDALTAATGAPTAPLPVLDDVEDDDEGEGLDDGAVESSADDVSDLWDAIGERLRRRGALVPEIAEIETVPDEEASEGPSATAEEDDPSIGGDASAVELDLPDPESLDMDRLSSLRPELALQATSAWVLIRNPTEVEAFLRRGYLQGPLDPDVRGSVSVTLWIDQRGAVQWAEVSESSGRRDLDEYALELFNEVAAFKAAREGGVSVSRSVTLSLNFPW